jgi:hypothetical protein
MRIIRLEIFDQDPSDTLSVMKKVHDRSSNPGGREFRACRSKTPM